MTNKVDEVKNVRIAEGRLMAYMLMVVIAVIFGCTEERGFPPEPEVGSNFVLKPSTNRLEFVLDENSTAFSPQSIQELELVSIKGSLVNWTLITDTPWITFNSRIGQTSTERDKIGVAINTERLTPGMNRGSFSIVENTGTHESTQKQEVAVTVVFCEKTCIYVSPENAGREITSLMFGGQSEYLNNGSGIWDSIVTDDCQNPEIPPGIPHQKMLEEVAPLGIGILRYPSGIPSDFFHWDESVGPMTSRVPQINPWDSAADDILKECPVFGPDEFVQYANLLDADLFITANVGTGTAGEAADWLSYYENKGVKAEYWEIGNEIYIDAAAYIFTFMPAKEYATVFDEYALALRQVNPDVKVGVIMSPTDQEWNRGVLATIKEPFDFITLHTFQPQIDTCLEFSENVVYRALLASPLFVTTQLDLIRDAAEELAIPSNRSPVFSITEWGPWFLHFCEPGDVQNNDARGRTMASALFSGLIWNRILN